MVDAVKLSSQVGVGEDAILHQTLHGYSDGHRLLESSIKLPEDLSRLMLRMSDLSGSNNSSGFAEYITGYPLNSADAFALAKTWYATEMPRPGCVWTHTVVIPRSVMAQIPDLRTLKSLFSRPNRQAGYGSFAKEISIDNVFRVTAHRLLSPVLSGQIQTLLSFHYGNNESPILIPAQNSNEFEDAVFAVWSQKWPALRMAFTFCTGSLSARAIGTRSFDIQCVPVSMTREVSLEIVAAGGPKALVMGADSVVAQTWNVFAAADASCDEGGEVRRFLWAVSDDSSGPREFSSFMAVFGALRESSMLSDLLRVIARTFPEPNAGSRLKILLFGRPVVRNLLPDHDEADVLFAIGTTHEYPALDGEVLCAKERGAEFCANRPDEAGSLIGRLFRSSLNQLGEDILAGAISALNPIVARQFTKDQPQFLPALFKAKPNLAVSSELWAAVGDRKRELFEAIDSNEAIATDLLEAITRALLESNSDSLIRRALEKWGKPAVFGALDWVADHSGRMSTECHAALTFHVEAVMDWVEASPNRPLEALLAAAHIIAPYSYKLVQRDTSVWLEALHRLRKSVLDPESLHLRAFLLALAFGNAPPSPLTLVSECFESVHRAVANDEMPDDAWVILDPIVPRLNWSSSWDKCERIRRGLIEAFVRNQWPASALIQCISNGDLLQRVRKSARKVAGWD